jgi:hypothetical protein
VTSDTEPVLVFARLKRRFFVGLLASAALLVASVAVWCVEGNQQLRVAAIIGACLFAFYGAYNIWEVRDPTPGLIIDREGIVPNLSSAPIGRIPWSDITGFRIYELMGTRFVVVDVADHKKYLDQLGRTRSVAKLATDLAGSPIDFTGESIGLTSEELLRVLNDARQKYGVA